MIGKTNASTGGKVVEGTITVLTTKTMTLPSLGFVPKTIEIQYTCTNMYKTAIDGMMLRIEYDIATNKAIILYSPVDGTSGSYIMLQKNTNCSNSNIVRISFEQMTTTATIVLQGSYHYLVGNNGVTEYRYIARG